MPDPTLEFALDELEEFTDELEEEITDELEEELIDELEDELDGMLLETLLLEVTELEEPLPTTPKGAGCAAQSVRPTQLLLFSHPQPVWVDTHNG